MQTIYLILFKHLRDFDFQLYNSEQKINKHEIPKSCTVFLIANEILVIYVYFKITFY